MLLTPEKTRGLQENPPFNSVGGDKNSENRCAATDAKVFAESEFMDGNTLGSNEVGFRA